MSVCVLSFPASKDACSPQLAAPSSQFSDLCFTYSSLPDPFLKGPLWLFFSPSAPERQDQPNL